MQVKFGDISQLFNLSIPVICLFASVNINIASTWYDCLLLFPNHMFIVQQLLGTAFAIMVKTSYRQMNYETTILCWKYDIRRMHNAVVLYTRLVVLWTCSCHWTFNVKLNWIYWVIVYNYKPVIRIIVSIITVKIDTYSHIHIIVK